MESAGCKDPARTGVKGRGGGGSGGSGDDGGGGKPFSGIEPMAGAMDEGLPCREPVFEPAMAMKGGGERKESFILTCQWTAL